MRAHGRRCFRQHAAFISCCCSNRGSAQVARAAPPTRDGRLRARSEMCVPRAPSDSRASVVEDHLRVPLLGGHPHWGVAFYRFLWIGAVRDKRRHDVEVSCSAAIPDVRPSWCLVSCAALASASSSSPALQVAERTALGGAFAPERKGGEVRSRVAGRRANTSSVVSVSSTSSCVAGRRANASPYTGRQPARSARRVRAHGGGGQADLPWETHGREPHLSEASAGYAPWRSSCLVMLASPRLAARHRM